MDQSGSKGFDQFAIYGYHQKYKKVQVEGWERGGATYPLSLHFFCIFSDIHIWQIAQNLLIHFDPILIQFINTQKLEIIFYWFLLISDYWFWRTYKLDQNWIKVDQRVLSNLPYMDITKNTKKCREPFDPLWSNFDFWLLIFE